MSFTWLLQVNKFQQCLSSRTHVAAPSIYHLLKVGFARQSKVHRPNYIYAHLNLFSLSLELACLQLDDSFSRFFSDYSLSLRKSKGFCAQMAHIPATVGHAQRPPLRYQRLKMRH